MRTTNRAIKLAALGGLLCMLQNVPTLASMITVAGAHVDFSYDSSLLGLFGTPTVAGDNLFFSPTAFTATSLNGTGLATTTATTFIDIQAHPGFDFAGMTLTEQGDYKLRGSSGFVAASGELVAMDKNNPPATGPGTSSFLVTPDNMALSDGALHPWSASAQVDLSGAAWTNTDTVRITLEDLLEGYTATGNCVPVTPSNIHGRHNKQHTTKPAANTDCGAQLAFIQKKYSGLSVAMSSAPASVVPIAPSAPLFCSGILTMLGIALRGRGVA